MASAAADDGEDRTRILLASLPQVDRAAPAGQRIEALDFVRGAALFGILLMNITGFGLPNAYINPMNAGGATGLNLFAWIFTQIGFEGTQRALFSMLFGASAILLTSRLEASGRTDAADIYMRRNLWLIGFGFLNAFFFLWYGDILYAYGVGALFLFAFRKLSARWLLSLGLVVLLLGAAWSLYEAVDLIGKYEAGEAAQTALDNGATLTPEQENAIFAWQNARTQFKATPESIQQTTQAMRSGYWSAFRHVARINGTWQTWGLYRYFFDMFGMMLIGMALFKLGVLTLERGTGLYVAMVLIGYAIGLSVNFAETRWILTHQFSALSFAQTAVTYDAGRLAMTMGHLGALLLFVRAGMLGFVRRAVAAVGQMAVTHYLGQSVICAILFVGLGWYNQLERYQLYYVVAGIWAFQLLFSVLWLRSFRFGPVEWVWRWLTYLKRPPLRREAATTA